MVTDSQPVMSFLTNKFAAKKTTYFNQIKFNLPCFKNYAKRYYKNKLCHKYNLNFFSFVYKATFTHKLKPFTSDPCI